MKLSTDQSEPPTDGTPSDDGAVSATRVGEILAAERERLGLSVEQAAEALRLKPWYLEAIEAGRLEELPGTTYAVGFIRAYADYLGLDSNEVIRRFRGEADTLSRPTTLSFPSISTGGRAPGSGVLLFSAFVAVLIYGLWHYFAAGERRVVDLVPPVPAQMSQTASEPAARDETAVLSSGAAAATPGEAGAPVAAGVAQASPAQATQPDAQANGGSTPAETAAAHAETATTVAPADQPAVSKAAAANLRPNADAASAETQLASRRPAGSEQGESRIVVHATVDSWIEVQDDDGTVLLRQMLRAGDNYRVPNRPGLTLMTGNAGGIEVSVDGKPGHRLGPTGFVRRNVPLDPDQLLSGAVGE